MSDKCHHITFSILPADLLRKIAGFCQIEDILRLVRADPQVASTFEEDLRRELEEWFGVSFSLVEI